MTAKCEVVDFQTPENVILHGLWFGHETVKKALIFVHGLAGSSFNLNKTINKLSDKNTGVLKFDNRGHDVVSELIKIDKRKRKGYKVDKLTGAAHEVFSECTDDIEGAVNFVQGRGAEKIFLIGHSTGCHKSIYYLAKNGVRNTIDALILLCPVSDYAAISKEVDTNALKRASDYARRKVSEGKPHELLPEKIWSYSLLDAQRFLSLYTAEGEEEIFTYAQEDKTPDKLESVKIPTLAVLASDDEYHDRPAKEIANWFRKHSSSNDLSINIVKGALHSFNRKEKRLTAIIKNWINER
jgi:alpha-beta hydrolase superfamily lysophospholipase